MSYILKTTRLPCVVCGSTHRTHSQRIAGGKWEVMCVSCHAALVKLKQWHAANPKLDVSALVRVYVECVPKPGVAAPAPPRIKIA